MSENGDYVRRRTCSLCAHDAFKFIVDLPPTPLANAFSRRPGAEQPLYPLELMMCERCKHVQTSIIVDPSTLFADYPYATSTSQLTTAHVAEEVTAVVEVFGMSSKIVEVGSNDGAFLASLAVAGWDRARTLGIDPSPLADLANKRGLATQKAFFTKELAKELSETGWNGSVVVANNVLAHVPSVKDALEGIAIIAGDEGGLVMEVAHAADVLWDGAFDTIYHEHTSYHALGPLQEAIEATGLSVFRAELDRSQLGRGSLRVYAARGRKPSRVEASGIAAIKMSELTMGLYEPSTWRSSVDHRVSLCGGALRAFMSGRQGRKIAGFGAPAKMTTLLYTCGVTAGGFSMIGEDSPWKIGKFTPGMCIPIVSREAMLAAKPEAIVLFAWNFAEDVIQGLRGAGYESTIFIPAPAPRFM